MSAPSHPELIRGSRARFLPLIIVALSTALGGCAGGDFGRTRRDFVTDDMHRWIGVEATGSVGLRASDFQLTDGERALRDQAYPYIEPPRARPAWKSVFGDYQPIAAPWRQSPPFDRTAYGKLLVDEPHRSHASRYQALIEDVRNDLTQFEPFQFTAQRVLELDRKRAESLKYISDLAPKERADAVARIEENALIVQWVEQCLHRRVASYRWALERLVIMAPDGMAADADRLIAELDVQATNAGLVVGPGRGRAIVSKG